MAADGPLSYLALCADFSADEVRGGLTDPVFIRWDRQDRQHQSHLSIRVPFITGKALLGQRLTRLGVLIVAESVEPTLPRFAALPAMAVNKSTTRWMLLQTSVTNYSAYFFNNIPFLICCWLRRLGLSRTYCDNGSSALHADFTVATFSPQVRRVHVYVSGNICARRPISAGSAVSPYPYPHSQGLERLVHFSLCRDFKRGASRRIPRSFHRIPATKNPHFQKE